MRKQLARLAVLAVLAAGLLPVRAEAAPEKAMLNLHSLPRESMVMLQGGNMTGFYVDLWSAIVRRAGYRSIIHLEHTQEDVLKSLETGRAQAAIGEFGMNPAYLDKIEYSYAILATGLQIMVLKNKRSMFSQVMDDAVSMLASPYMATVLGFLVLATFVGGNLFWLVERKSNPDVPTRYLPGMRRGVWWAMVTLSTVGYGDIIPKTRLGKLFGLWFIMLSVVLTAGFVSMFTAKLTVGQFNVNVANLGDLAGTPVGTLSETIYVDFLKERKVDVMTFPTAQDAVRNLLDGKVAAVVLEEQQLQRYESRQGGGRFQIVGSPFRPMAYAVAFPKGSPYLAAVNKALLEIRADGTYMRIYRKWFQNTAEE
ncbi:MAG: polar amino acid transport system substrate-binding protein [Desulfovibrionales bacterium]|nr:polar amino acid transport system substrate-binding protein [Desulfovibrionales bacterium]